MQLLCGLAPRSGWEESVRILSSSSWVFPLDSVQGNARAADASFAEEIAAALNATDKDVEIGGAGLAAQAIELGLVDELRMFRYPARA